MKRILILLFFLFSLLEVSKAQSGLRNFTGSFENTLLLSAIETVEAQTNIRVFVDPEDIDSLHINGEFDDTPPLEVLRELLKGTSFHVFQNEWGQAVITQGYQVRPYLPDNFFARDGKQEQQLDVATFEIEKQRIEQVADTSLVENKVFEIGVKTGSITPGNATIAGYVRDKKTGEAIIGAVVYTETPTRQGTATNQFGYYSLPLPKGTHTLFIKNIGMKETRRKLIVYGDGILHVEMVEDIIPLKEVIVEAERDANIQGVQMGLERLNIQTLKQMPSALGETDILKTVITLPGVQTVGEAAAGFNVRGGSTDQNLILLNDAPVFNPSHLFGFFSSFNPDVIKGVEFYRGGIPARYGGRISSVFEVKMKDGNKKEFAGNGGIGPFTGRMAFEGPIIKDKASFLLGARSSYSDWLLRRLPNGSFRNSTGNFYDVNARLSYNIDEKNTLSVNGYLSRDNFSLNSDSLYRYQNNNMSVQWNRIFNSRLFATFSAILSNYSFDISSDRNPETAFNLNYNIAFQNLKADFSFTPENFSHKIDFGLSSIRYQLDPGSLQPNMEESNILPKSLARERALEHAIYIDDKYDVNDRLTLYAGLRYSLYTAYGPADVFTYSPGFTRDVLYMQDTVSYKSGAPLATYHGPEYRASIRYLLNNQSSLKLGFNRMRQYIHMITNTAAIAPTDTWKLSDRYIRPQVGDQLSLGYYKNMRYNTIEASAEVYVKRTRDILDYKNGAVLLLNEHIETDVINGLGRAYGMELMLKKLTGKLNGWVSYTYSRSFNQVNGPFPEEQVNNGEFFPTNFDKPHDITMVSNYKFNRRFSLSVNYTYSTGRPVTYPLSRYELNNAGRLYYSDRNQYRVPDYSRLDLALTLEGNHKIKKLAHSSWTFSLFNVLGRNNVYSIYFVSRDNLVKGYKLSIFARPIPTLTYNFRF